MAGEYFEIYSNVEGGSLLVGNRLQWRWRLRSGNHEPIASGEGYNTRQACEHAINLIKSTTMLTPVVDLDKK
ncbi:YegP family protein [Lysobacter enzymogenes]|uniref:DUF1508 domain-containing protein n=1 Tax=Lysobacter enzymogenes TaxID=69 RepID=A0A3N2RPV0_LYSEN|nr:DUF1508 domain-containing protein [Lysobacter enzymogenes]ROU09439.1 DUF1508 domain-containing protein [Lysobacter enzymogenes]